MFELQHEVVHADSQDGGGKDDTRHKQRSVPQTELCLRESTTSAQSLPHRQHVDYQNNSNY